MPKIDPFTGCEVMTQAEFWVSEAKHEGKGRSGFELMEEMMNEIEDDNQRISNEMRNDPEAALQIIKNYLDGGEDDDETIDCYGFCSRHIKKLTKVIEARYDGSMRGTDVSMTVKLKMTDGSIRTVEYSEWTDHGSQWGPPDGGNELTIIAVNDVPVVNRLQRDEDAPLCAVCQRLGPPATKLGEPNSADYLVPLSDDQGKTIKGWEFRCGYHMSRGDGPNLDDWYGPIIKLNKHGKETYPILPRVREDDDE